MKKTNINDLYFGVKLYPLSFVSGRKKELQTYNLFDFASVKWSVASYVAKEKKETVSDPVLYCFGDVWSRTEFEFMVCPWGGLREEDKVVDKGTKMDVYAMFVEPNAELLMKMVNNVSVSSAKAYLKEWRKKWRNVSR